MLSANEQKNTNVKRTFNSAGKFVISEGVGQQLTGHVLLSHSPLTCRSAGIKPGTGKETASPEVLGDLILKRSL